MTAPLDKKWDATNGMRCAQDGCAFEAISSTMYCGQHTSKKPQNIDTPAPHVRPLDIDAIVERAKMNGSGTTHWEGCERQHTACGVIALAAEVRKWREAHDSLSRARRLDLDVVERERDAVIKRNEEDALYAKRYRELGAKWPTHKTIGLLQEERDALALQVAELTRDNERISRAYIRASGAHEQRCGKPGCMVCE